MYIMFYYCPFINSRYEDNPFPVFQWHHFTQEQDINKPHVTTTLVMMSHESNTCFVFALQVCFLAHVRVDPHIVHPCIHQLNAKDTDTEKALLSCDVITTIPTKVLVK